MKIFLTVMLLFGFFELISNVFHLSRKHIADISKSARKQHQELDLRLSDNHFFYKARIMLIFGILFFTASLFELLHTSNLLFWILSAFGLYSAIQAFVYRKNIKAWSAMIVYNIPLIIYLFLG